ncbi:hypothetical protein EV182_002126 [Spiromyces aspiralis]|uniref:Uncharacterized protein n=1 Tax=Spiromyces aspiralis TaxID=68401 RepID=A0ACC1HWC5_9FUNG|nr:hypothetical protein EV182_002126 [Spiromyces aspiralis]
MPRLSRLDIRIDVYKLPYILQLIGSSSLLISDLSIHAIYPSSTIANHKVDTEAAQAMDSFCHGRGFCTLEIPNCVVGPKFFDAVLTHKSRCLQTLRMSVTLRSTYLSSIQQPTAPLTRLTFTNVHIENEFSQIGLQSKHFPYLRELCINSITTPLPDITVVHTQRLFNSMFASPWPRLEKVQLPYMTDEVAAMVARNCPNLEFLDICSKYTHINLSHHLVDLTNQNQRFLTDRGFLDLVGSLERLKVLIIGNPYETCHHVVTGAVTQRPVIDRWVCKKLGHLEIVDWDVVPTDIDSVKSVFPRLFISTTFISNLAQNIAAPSNDGGEVSEAAGWMSQLLSRSWGLFEGVGRRVGRRIMHLLW